MEKDPEGLRRLDQIDLESISISDIKKLNNQLSAERAARSRRGHGGHNGGQGAHESRHAHPRARDVHEPRQVGTARTNLRQDRHFRADHPGSDRAQHQRMTAGARVVPNHLM